jgi:hypothetical protein
MFRRKAPVPLLWGNPATSSSYLHFKIASSFVRAEGLGAGVLHVLSPPCWVLFSAFTLIGSFGLCRPWNHLESNIYPFSREYDFAQSHCSFYAGEPFF